MPCAQVLELLRKAEKELKAKQDRDYLDSSKSEEEKQKGNDAFKKQLYPEAVKHYTEAIRRNPEDHTLYSNRAAAYTKLMAYPDVCTLILCVSVYACVCACMRVEVCSVPP